ncbi:MAG TPA: N-acetyltransferase [Prolixibacteraceae bacterium]|nr:N-acetyltransferase [Prolixibacteraceae bacterium]
MNEQIIIRKEVPDDYQRVFELTEKAFETMEISDHNEGKLVENLRKSDMFISDLSLVAEQNKQVVGHVLFTPVLIDNGQELFESLTLAPVSVLPEYQNQGIGSKLINEGHRIARQLGFTSVIVVGHAEYYPRFGYKPASVWKIRAPFELPSDDVFMALELKEGALNKISGKVVFPEEFTQ